ITFEVRALPASPGGTVGDIFPDVAVDSAGNVYGTWIDEADHNVFVSASRGRGTTWSAPLHVNGHPANTNVWAWSAARAPAIADDLAGAVAGAGAGHNVYDDTTNQHHGAAVVAAKQIAGPGALGKKIRGTAPVNPMADPTGDAQYPHFTPAGPGRNQPQMDF